MPNETFLISTWPVIIDITKPVHPTINNPNRA